jgi:hypothetical protein
LANHGTIRGDNVSDSEEDEQKLACQKDDLVADDNIKPKRAKGMDQILRFCTNTSEQFPADSAQSEISDDAWFDPSLLR